jgi:hypothetical protein
MTIRRVRRHPLWLALAMVATLMAGRTEAAPFPGFALISQTQHFSFYSRDPRLKVEADKAEQFLREISTLLQQPVEERTEFFRHERPEDIAAYTGVYSTGFAELGGPSIHSVLPYHPHEIVHIVAFRIGRPGDFFQEGLAVALGDGGKIHGQRVDRIAKQALTRTSAGDFVTRFRDVDPTAAYAVAGSFVTHLIETHGLPKVVELFKACPNAPSQCEAAFAGVFGRPLTAELAAWTAAL